MLTLIVVACGAYETKTLTYVFHRETFHTSHNLKQNKYNESRKTSPNRATRQNERIIKSVQVVDLRENFFEE